MAAELQAIHRQDISEFRKTGIAKLPHWSCFQLSANPIQQPPQKALSYGKLFYLRSKDVRFAKPRPAVHSESPEISDEAKQTPLPPSLTIIAMSRPITGGFWKHEDSLSDLVYWWITVGRKEYAGLREEINRDLLRSLHIDHLSREDIRVGLLSHAVDRHSGSPAGSAALIRKHDNGILTLWRWWFEGVAQNYSDRLIGDRRGDTVPAPTRHGLFDQTGAVPLTTLVHAISRNPI